MFRAIVGSSVLFLMMSVINYEPLVVFHWDIPTTIRESGRQSIRIQSNGRQRIRCFIPQAIFYSLMLQKMATTIARNMSS